MTGAEVADLYTLAFTVRIHVLDAITLCFAGIFATGAIMVLIQKFR